MVNFKTCTVDWVWSVIRTHGAFWNLHIWLGMVSYPDPWCILKPAHLTGYGQLSGPMVNFETCTVDWVRQLFGPILHFITCIADQVRAFILLHLIIYEVGWMTKSKYRTHAAFHYLHNWPGDRTHAAFYYLHNWPDDRTHAAFYYLHNWPSDRTHAAIHYLHNWPGYWNQPSGLMLRLITYTTDQVTGTNHLDPCCIW